MRQDWPRWIFVSLASYLKDVANSQSLPSIIETVDERTTAFMQAPARAEVRITGPFISEPSKGYYQALVDVNVLLTYRFGCKSEYDILTVAGAFQEAMNSPIAVTNLGGEEGDYVEGQPDTLLQIGCLMPRFGQKQRVLNFGQISVVDHLKQLEVEARYLLELQE